MLKHGQTPACIDILNELFKKSFYKLSFNLTDEHIYDGSMGTKIFSKLLSAFKGERLKVSNCLTSNVNFEKVFSET